MNSGTEAGRFGTEPNMKMESGKRFDGTDRPGVWNCGGVANHHRAPSDLGIIPINVFHIGTLKREREFLAKRLFTRLSAEERDTLYIKWNVPLEGKHRKLQFVNMLWTNPHDTMHSQENAETVAKLAWLASVRVEMSQKKCLSSISQFRAPIRLEAMVH
ncbi:hypothetical protein Sjap_024950 [Stephania japonica]|uniref:NPK1-activating kinesin-like protein C-terminal domain-containing protein n=1 Tax=Stephania japonica TaxID=461633 RepID=A0AAP0EJP7_9MAGN